MARKLSVLLTLGLVLAFPAIQASAQVTFLTTLLGSNENPPNASPGTGFGSVVLNAAGNQITVNESWSGLTAAATASHIHMAAPPGTNAPVVFPFTGVTAATSGSIPQQTFAITPTQVAQMFGGLAYMNVHTSTFPGGEIRGQLLASVPEPGIAGMLLGSLTTLGLVIRRRKRA
jgi:hypothetical protein